MFGRKDHSSLFGAIQSFDQRQTSRGPRTSRLVVATVTFFVGANFALAVSTSVPELARANGQIQPTGHIQQVESTEGGRVVELLAEEGQRVKAGELLAVLYSPDLETTKYELQQQLDVVSERLVERQAVLALLDEAPKRSTLQVQSESHTMHRFELVKYQQSMQTDLLEHLNRNLSSLEEGLVAAQDQLGSLEAARKRQENLFELGLTTQAQVAGTAHRVAQSQNMHLDFQLRIAGVQQEIQSANFERARLEMVFREELLDELAHFEKERDSLMSSLSSTEAKVAELSVRSPSDGTIQAVAFPNLGEVISAGETLFEIMPANYGLVLDIEILPTDIGHIAIGDEVKIKIDTFDARRFGFMSGNIHSISPTSVRDEGDGKEFFRATVSLSSNSIGEGPWEREVQAGMNATAEIVTGDRSLVTYLTKPISRTLEGSFSER